MVASATDYNCYYSITHNVSQVNTDNEDFGTEELGRNFLHKVRERRTRRSVIS